MRKALAAALALLVLLSSLQAGSYTLDDLIASMLVNNTDIRSAESAVTESHLDLKDAYAEMQPEITLDLMAMYMPDPVIGDITVNTNDLLTQMGYSPASVGYDLTLYDGMPQTYYAASVSLEQPVITWGKLAYNAKMRKAIEDARKLQRTDTEKQLTAELKARLAALYYIAQADGLLESIIETSAELVDLSERSGESGMLIRTAVMDARLSAKEAELSRMELEAQKASVLEGLREMTGLYDIEAEDIDFTPDEEEYGAILSLGLESLIGMATDPGTLSMRMVEKQKTAAKYAKKITDRSLYLIPDLGLRLSASYGGSSLPFIETGWSGDDDWNLMVTVALSTTIWDGGKKLNDRNRAKSAIVDAEITKDDVTNMLRQAVTDAYNSASLSLARAEYGRLRIENAEYKLSDAQRGYETGAMSRIDVLSAELELCQEELKLVTESITLAQNCYTLSYLADLGSAKAAVISDGKAE